MALISALLGVTGLGLLAASAAPAPLVAEDHRGAVTGTLLSGSIGGMLLSRVFGGGFGELLGGRAPYLTAAAARSSAAAWAPGLPYPPTAGSAGQVSAGW